MSEIFAGHEGLPTKKTQFQVLDHLPEASDDLATSERHIPATQMAAIAETRYMD